MSPGGNSPETIKLKNHHLSLLIQPEGGRILEVESLETGGRLVSWWPYRLDAPEGAGGIGEASEVKGAPRYSWKEERQRVSLKRCLPGGLVLEKVITLGADSLVFTMSMTLRNKSETYRSFRLDQSAAVCPGCGGASPRPESGISNCHETAILKRPDEEPEVISYEVFEKVDVERDDLEWTAFNDPVSGNLFAVMGPKGHWRLRTTQHWWLEWSRLVRLEPGARYTGEFAFAATGDIDLPAIVGEHFVAGFAGEKAALAKEAGGKVIFYGLDPVAAGNELSVRIDGKEVVAGKPLPGGAGPFEVKLPERRSEDGALVEMSAGGKFGQVRLWPCRCSETYEQLEGLCDQAVTSFKKGHLSQTKAASVLALKRIVDLGGDKGVEEVEAILFNAFFGASGVLESGLEAVAFYSEAEKKTQKRLAGHMDWEEAAAGVRGKLARPYDLSVPRFRVPDSERGAFVLAKELLEAALLLTVRRDDEVEALFRERFGELTALWSKYGAILYETIHHGVVLSSLVPAVRLASEGGWIGLAEEAETLAMVFDLCAKVERQGGRQFRLSNWWAMEDAPAAYLGALFPYLPGSAKCMARARDTFYWLLVHGTFADGGFWEMSPSYHVTTLTYLYYIAEAFLRSGENFFHGETCGKRLRDMVDYLKAIAVAPGSVPAFDDSGREMAGEVLLSLSKRLYDGELLYHAEAAFARAGRAPGAWNLFVPVDAPEKAAPNRRSEVLGASGKLVMRSSCGNLAFIFDFGPHGGWHGHSDKLTFEAFWRDVCLVGDAGSYKYEEALHWDWFKTARAHNTVTLDDNDRVEASGRLIYFEEGRGFVTAGLWAPVSDRVTQRREVTLSDRTLLVDDFLEGAVEGENIVWRLNSFAEIKVEGQSAHFERGGVQVAVRPVTDGAVIHVARAALMSDDPRHTKECVDGWQLQIRKEVTGDSARILVRMDFSW